MNKPFLVSQAAVRLTTWLVTGLLATFELRAGPGPTPSTEEPKQYIVFAGADVLADFGGESCHVIGAKAGSLELLSETKTEVAPESRVNHLRAVRGVKLSTLTATIGKIRAESLRIAFYSEQAERSFDSNTATRDEEMKVAMAKATVRSGDTAFGPAAKDWLTAREQQVSALEQKESNIANLQDVLDDAAANQTDKADRDAEDRKAAAKPAGTPALPFPYDYDSEADGLAIKCEISSPDPLEKAYLAVNLRYLDPGMPRRILQRTEIEPVPHIGKKPRKATLKLRGLPRGFGLVGCEVDLYANDQEVTTNLSGKQIAMTEEQVYQFFLSNHLSRNRGKTCPPAPLLMAPPGEVRRQVDRAGVGQDIYAQVDNLGRLVSLSMAEDKLIEVTPQILFVMRFIRFFPGLEDGKPAEGHVKFRPADLLQ